MQQVDDLRAEAEDLRVLLAGLMPADWSRPTQFKDWTPNDIVQHLHIGDVMGLTSATDPAAFGALIADMRDRRAAGLSRVEETRQRLGNPTGPRLLDLWRTTNERLCDALAARDPADRLKWAGPDMGVRMFTTARQMEHWAHAQAIWDMLGRDRPPPASRLRNIAEIGVRTFGWTYRIRDLPVPATMPYVRLTGPGGETWEWNDPAAADSIRGDAVAFCQVVAQTRNVADTTLAVEGQGARHWMSIAQCFAGGAEPPPTPGTRFKVARS